MADVGAVCCPGLAEFRYIDIGLHTWDHAQVARAMRAFADGGYKILSIDTARLDGRKEYGMLIDVAFALDVDDGSDDSIAAP